jgi:hypothetical protein
MEETAGEVDLAGTVAFGVEAWLPSEACEEKVRSGEEAGDAPMATFWK